MTNIRQVVQELISRADVAAGDDLNILADMHTQLQCLAEMGSTSEIPVDLGNRALGLVKELERIILREATDSAAAIQHVQGGLAQMQAMLDGLSPEAAAASVAAQMPKPAAQPQAPAAAPAHADFTEQPFNPDDLPLVNDFVGEARAHIESAEESVLKLEENCADSNAINAIFRSFHTVKGVAGFLNLRQIGALAHCAENLLDLARQGKVKLSGPSVDLILSATDMLKNMVAAVETAVKEKAIVPPEIGLDVMLKRLTACANGASSAAPADTAAPAASVAVKSTAVETTGKPKSGAPAESNVKISTERLDSLINMVGELVIAQAMASQDTQEYIRNNHRLARNLGHLAKITRELQELSMSMRMVPIQGVFQKMNRLVRDLEKKTGKEIELELIGGETELDRTLIEAITDPLVHMVRNSADHGIEMPDDREKAGKPRAGRLTLKAYHHSGNIAVEISDDGKGLPTAKILKKAIANGILPEGAQPSEAEIFKLIFHAGLSTAEKVTDVSGRGVGMDVVKRNVESLRGRIDIASVEGKGATFTISLPLTLAVIDGMLIKTGGQKFILPTLSVEQSLRPTAGQVSTVQGRGEVCVVRDHLLAMYRLDELLGISNIKADPTKSIVVIVHHDNQRCCLLVEELLGQQQVVIKSLGDGIGHVPGVSGSAILGDGNVSLILDVSALMRLAATNTHSSN